MKNAQTSKCLNSLSDRVLGINSFYIIPRTMAVKAFNVFTSGFPFLYVIIKLVLRKCTLKTKYTKGFKVLRFKLLIIPMRN